MNLLKAIKKIPNQKLVVVGNGKNYKKKCLKYIQVNNLEKNILFINNLSLNEIRAIYAKAQIMIYPSIFEGFGIPILDALSLNIPSLATSIPSYHEIKNLNRQNKIYLVNQNKPKVWIDYLNKVQAFNIKNNYEKRRRIEHFKVFKVNLEENFLLKIGYYLNKN